MDDKRVVIVFKRVCVCEIDRMEDCDGFLLSFLFSFFFEKGGRGEECEVNICIFANFFLYSYFHLHLNVKLR